MTGQMTWKARFLWVFLVSIAITVVIAITAIVYDDMPYQEEILLSSFLFALHALGALLGAVMWQRKRARRMVWLGVGVLLIGGLLWIALIWVDGLNLFDRSLERLLQKTGGTGTTAGLAFMLRGLVLWPENRPRAVRVLSFASWVCGAVAALVLLFAIWTDGWWWDEDILVKTFASMLTIAAGCGVGVFVVARLTQGDLVEHEDSALGNRMLVNVKCPRCGQFTELRANTYGRCMTCDLKLKVEFEEPRCACGYLLHGLTGDVCPECGQSIKSKRGWGGEEEPAPEAPPPTDQQEGTEHGDR